VARQEFVCMAPGVMVTVSKSLQKSSGFMSVRSIRFMPHVGLKLLV